MKSEYLESIILTERIYKLFLDVLKVQLKKWNVVDINNVQALIIYQIGKDKIAIGELIRRGYYLGSNVSYNLKKMISTGYVEQTKSDFDKRSNFIRLTKKGMSLFEKLDQFFSTHSKALLKEGVSEKVVFQSSELLKKVESFLNKAMYDYI